MKSYEEMEGKENDEKVKKTEGTKTKKVTRAVKEE